MKNVPSLGSLVKYNIYLSYCVHFYELKLQSFFHPFLPHGFLILSSVNSPFLYGKLLYTPKIV